MRSVNLVIVGLLIVLVYLVTRRSKYGFKRIDTSLLKAPRSEKPAASLKTSSETRSLTPTLLDTPSMDLHDQDEDIRSDAREVTFAENEVEDRPSLHTSSTASNRTLVEDVISVDVDSIVDMFTPRLNHATTLGISQEDLDGMVSEYKEKYFREKRSLPSRNIHFNRDSWNSVLDTTLKSSALSIYNRNVRSEGDKDFINDVYKSLAERKSVEKGTSRTPVDAPTSRGKGSGRRHIPIDV